MSQGCKDLTRPTPIIWTSLVAQKVKHLPTMQETPVQSLGQEDLLERKWQPIPVFLPGKSHRQRGLAEYNPWGCKRAGHG